MTPENADRQALLDEWVVRHRAAGLSEKTIQERLGIICRLPNAATLTAVDVDRFLANPAWSRSTRATYHGAIRAWRLFTVELPFDPPEPKWLVRTGRRADDPTPIATRPKDPKGRPRPVADEHLAVLLMQCTAVNLLPTLDQLDEQPSGVRNMEGREVIQRAGP